MKFATRALVALTSVAAGSLFAATDVGAAVPALAPSAASSVPTTPPVYPEPSGVRPDGWTYLTDYTATLNVAVPPAWRQIELMPALNDDGSPRPWLAATPDMATFLPPDGEPDTFGVPGMVFLAHPEIVDTLATMAGSEYHEVCTAQPVQRFVRGWVRGHIQEFTGCGGTATRLVFVAGHIDGLPHTYLVLVQLTGAPDDAAVLEGVLSTFSPVTVPGM